MQECTELRTQVSHCADISGNLLLRVLPETAEEVDDEVDGFLTSLAVMYSQGAVPCCALQ